MISLVIQGFDLASLTWNWKICTRTTLTQLRSDWCRLLKNYQNRVDEAILDLCDDCHNTPHDVHHSLGINALKSQCIYHFQESTSIYQLFRDLKLLVKNWISLVHLGIMMTSNLKSIFFCLRQLEKNLPRETKLRPVKSLLGHNFTTSDKSIISSLMKEAFLSEDAYL
uniref:Uncharacterized protein n=1 Tax=Megaselia scalaris TaxID=36166 RepID=T1GZC3_MEGSC